MTPTQDVQKGIRRYLLGQLPDSDREEIERDLMADEGFFAEFLILEDELADEYVNDCLTPDERANFERHFLATPERQESLQFAQALDRYVTDHAPAPDVMPRPPAGLLSSQNRFVRCAAVIALLAILAGGLWFLWPRQTSPQTFATLNLSTSLNTRDGGAQGPKVRLPLGKDALRISLTLPNPPPPAVGYRVQLFDGNDESRPLKILGHDAQSVVVEIPVTQLRIGQYALNLLAIKADGSEQRVSGSYYFTVE